MDCRYLFLILFISSSCEKVIDLNLDRNLNQLVISGLITNAPGPYNVNLKYTTAYSLTDSTQGIIVVQGAAIEINDDLGNTFPLTEITPPGNYITDSASFRGEVGRRYTLNIVTPNGKHYTSIPEKMEGVTPIDSIYYVFDPTYGNFGHFNIYIDMHDPPGKGNNYRWRYYIDQYLLLDVDVDNDIFYDGKTIKGREIGGWSQPKDTIVARVEQMSLSRQAYLFWKDLRNAYEPQNNSPYDVPPAPLIGNVYNVDDPSDYALGYFGASGISRASLVMIKR